jgi:hypothetical protein
MQQISSNTITTFYYKRAFPFIIFPASIAAMVITGAKSGADLFFIPGLLGLCADHRLCEHEANWIVRSGR